MVKEVNKMTAPASERAEGFLEKVQEALLEGLLEVKVVTKVVGAISR